MNTIAITNRQGARKPGLLRRLPLVLAGAAMLSLGACADMNPQSRAMVGGAAGGAALGGIVGSFSGNTGFGALLGAGAGAGAGYLYNQSQERAYRDGYDRARHDDRRYRRPPPRY